MTWRAITGPRTTVLPIIAPLITLTLHPTAVLKVSVAGLRGGAVFRPPNVAGTRRIPTALVILREVNAVPFA